jgi:hypothetical protein
VLERAIGQLCYDLPEYANYMFFKISAKLNGRSTITV